MINSKQMCI